MWSQLPNPLIIAHRGASLYAPENTLSAFELAVEQGVPALELDAKLCADGEIVVHHDATVDRTTNGTGRVSKLSFSALRELDAGSHFDEKFRGEKIPALAEVFEAVGKKIFINVELTNYTTRKDDLTERVCALVKRFGLQDSVMFSSFLPANLTKARSLLPSVPRGLLSLGGVLGWWTRSFGFAFGEYHSLNPAFKDVTPQQIQRVHKLKRKLFAYTVNNAEDMRRLFLWGIDGIFTDDPPLAFKMLEEAR
ncbi:MAG: glycerophosphodiester phosphodiesterase family protein [Anaerolineales bacterium]